MMMLELLVLQTFRETKRPLKSSSLLYFIASPQFIVCVVIRKCTVFVCQEQINVHARLIAEEYLRTPV
jgi:hypothetical protein